ncbi:hypothetical protein [Caballeronia arationis]|uniref:hypothetical protein n=1 Tax=Caballeronia arationis TaxID=1777142 RepID=UPI00135B303F|nr:hypothetical protein [Caballeronia arationis]
MNAWMHRMGNEQAIMPRTMTAARVMPRDAAIWRRLAAIGVDWSIAREAGKAKSPARR